MFSDIEWTKTGNTEHLFAIQARNLVLPGARVRKYVVERKLQRTSRNMRLVALQMVDIFKCQTSPPDISSDRPIITWTVEERRKRLPLPRYMRQQEDSHQDHVDKQFTTYLQPNLPVV